MRGPTAALMPSRSVALDVVDPGDQRLEGLLLGGLPVSDRAPKVRPWKPSTSATTSVRPGPPALRASFRAASLASAPELQKKTRPPSEWSRIHSASATIGSV